MKPAASVLCAGSSSACCWRRRRLCKGPQPATFFAFGVGAFILIKRDWKQLPGFVLAGVISVGVLASWYAAVLTRAADVDTLLEYMRLSRNETIFDYRLPATNSPTILVTFLPGLLIAAPALFDWARRQRTGRHRHWGHPAVPGAGALCNHPDRGTGGVAGRRDALCDAGLARRCRTGGALFRPACRAPRVKPFAAGAVYPRRAGLLSVRLGMDRRAAASPTRSARARIDARAVEAATRARPYTVFAPLRLADPVLRLSRPTGAVPQGKRTGGADRRRPICWPSRKRRR